MYGDGTSEDEKDIDGMDWMTIETNVRRIIMDLTDPIIKQGNNHKSSLQQYGKLIVEHNKRLDTVEAALFQARAKKTAFDEIDNKIESKFTLYFNFINQFFTLLNRLSTVRDLQIKP